MSAKRKATNVRSPHDDDNGAHATGDGRRMRTEAHVPNTAKKNHGAKKISKNGASSYKFDNLTPDITDQMGHTYIPQPYTMMDHAGTPNLIQPVLIDHANRPINMTLYPGTPCWCNQISNDMRAIRELVTAVSNGIHCILQKVHMDQAYNADIMSRMLNTVGIIAETVVNLPIAQLQEYEPYLTDEIPIETVNESPDDVDIAGPFYAQNDVEIPPDQHPNNNNFHRTEH